jgi:hypothetical protein
MFDERKTRRRREYRLPEGIGMTDRDAEGPVDDVVEQHQAVVPGDDDNDQESELPHGDLPLEADEADAAEQARSIGPDDDDYR